MTWDDGRTSTVDAHRTRVVEAVHHPVTTLHRCRHCGAGYWLRRHLVQWLCRRCGETM